MNTTSLEYVRLNSEQKGFCNDLILKYLDNKFSRPRTIKTMRIWLRRDLKKIHELNVNVKPNTIRLVINDLRSKDIKIEMAWDGKGFLCWEGPIYNTTPNILFGMMCMNSMKKRAATTLKNRIVAPMEYMVYEGIPEVAENLEDVKKLQDQMNIGNEDLVEVNKKIYRLTKTKYKIIVDEDDKDDTEDDLKSGI